jgi:hypothetical protein
VGVPAEYHAEIVRQIIDFNLTSKQVKELCQGDLTDNTDEDPIEKLSPTALKIAKVAQAIGATSPQELARALMQQEGDMNVARARLQAMQKLISDAERYLASE